MKQKLLLVVILATIIGVLLTQKKGLFNIYNSSKVSMTMPKVIDYNFHIRPILSDNCYTCHGPDANKRKAGLRLDLEETAFKS